MRVTGLLYNKPMSVLIDTGSTHNFLDPQIAKKTGLQVDNAAKFNVMVANGDTLSSTGRCDAVLGAHWLQTLGPILWDFNKMWMKFTLSGNHHQILGEPSKVIPTPLATLSPSLVRHLIVVIYSFPLLKVDLNL
ncbi:hypothetical protein Pint_19393 [Pistacia integerrima]|uniref:Uncharacterized protein n=1 Tax=Pistacia integerrima TaxID=434235 RepID=A0ACC0YWN4_9ROSI|nr:hypothetical protein Pint_19393 [Pistacia integerrima]